ncbi:hypothetical protein BJX62DRAFT_243329 [Aspergillus germanicus]
MLQKFLSIVVILLAVFYHVFFRDFLFTFIGVGRRLSQMQEFPYTCRRLEHPSLSSCEDLWLDEENRTLANNFNASGRQKRDHFSVLDIDHPGEDGLYSLRHLELTGLYRGVNPENDNVIDLHGFGVRKLTHSTLQFFVINHRPPTTTDGRLLNNTSVIGDNSTMEVFELERGSSKLEFIKTITDENLIAPNDLTWVSEGSILVTNDHSIKAGKLRQLQSYYGAGNLIACNLGSEQCHPVIPRGLRYANGVVQGHDGLIYLSEFVAGTVSAYKFLTNGAFVLVDTIT